MSTRETVLTALHKCFKALPATVLRGEVLLFTSADGKPGHKLSDYLPGDYVGARRIVNGTDRAQTVAGHALAFEAALAAGGYGPVQAGTPPEAPPGGLSAWVLTLIKSLTGDRHETR